MGKTGNRTESRCKDSEAEISQDCTGTMEDLGGSETRGRRGKKFCRPQYFIFLRSTMETYWSCFKVDNVKILLRLSGSCQGLCKDSQQIQHEENALNLT